MTDKSDDRTMSGHDGTARAKPLATVKLDMELMNELTASKGADSDSLGELMIRHRGLVLNELRRRNIRQCDIDDVANRVWDKVWRIGRDGTWDAGRARHCHDPFVPLLKTVANTQALDYHQRAAAERRRRDVVVSAFEAHGDDWRAILAGPSAKRSAKHRPQPSGVPEELAAAVATLPERLRKPYELHAGGMTNRKIADEVGCSWGEVSRRLKAARQALGLSVPTKPR
ncbi:MAG: sigma-70 family RNA polymerase sigma factor [Planctomycetes bacterium]|nr:sigma-70 family RNA polymerase sigma factor [Planctomycetota bacterium]